jgi:hypothetical protein
MLYKNKNLCVDKWSLDICSETIFKNVQIAICVEEKLRLKIENIDN